VKITSTGCQTSTPTFLVLQVQTQASIFRYVNQYRQHICNVATAERK